jgi:hypothetical protein
MFEEAVRDNGRLAYPGLCFDDKASFSRLRLRLAALLARFGDHFV